MSSSAEAASPKEDNTKEAPAAAAAASSTTDESNKNGEAAKDKKGNKKNGQDRKPREEQKPVEELFDLTKPIPHVDKPKKEEHEKQVEELSEEVKVLQDKRRDVQSKIDAGMDDPVTKGKLQEKRSEINALKKKKGGLIDEKNALRDKLKKIKDENEKIIKDKKDARSGVKFTNIEDINKEIAKLERKQETTSMSLTEEKKLIKEIDALQASKKSIADIKNKDAAIDDIKVQRKVLGDAINAKDKEIDKVSAEIDEVMTAIKAINEKDSTKRDTLQELFKERDSLRKQIAEKLKEKDAIRDDFREKNNAWYNYQRAVRAQKKMQYEEEKAKRDAERAEYEAMLEAEEAKKIPYEEEQALCEFLANFLERTYLGKTDEEGDKKSDVVAVKDDPFAGFTPVNKKADDEYFGKGKGKKKRVRGSKKQDSAAGPFTLSVDTFEQFGMIQLEPPTKIEEVEKSVKDLREKKEWYKQQPRGSVPTAQEIRRSNEKKAAKVRQQAQATEEKEANNGKSSNKNKKFSLDNDDFVPLGTAGAGKGGVNASWGQKSSTTAGEGEETTPDA